MGSTKPDWNAPAVGDRVLHVASGRFVGRITKLWDCIVYLDNGDSFIWQFSGERVHAVLNTIYSWPHKHGPYTCACGRKKKPLNERCKDCTAAHKSGRLLCQDK